jgi:hypothetical protein
LFPHGRPIDPGRAFDVRFSHEALELFEAAAARDSIEIIEFDQSDPAMPLRTTKLATRGLAKGLEELAKGCERSPNSVW